MADYIATSISIGGKLSSHLAEQLCVAVTEAQLGLEWAETPFASRTAADLLAARCQINGARVLKLMEDDAPWGEFQELEAFLQEHQIPFDRLHEGKYDIDPALRQYRPDLGCLDFHCTNSGEVLLPLAAIIAFESQVALVDQHLVAQRQQPAVKQLQSALLAFREQVARPVPLPELQIE